MDEIERYNSERNAVLLSGDLARFTAWARSKGMRFRNELQAETTMHKCIQAEP
jgi:hypothetical protein